MRSPIQAFGDDNRAALLKRKGLVTQNAGASLVGMGDGIFICEFHTKMNAIDADIVSMINESVTRVEKEGLGLILANDGEQFSVGANLMLVLLAARQKRFDEIDKMVREFQNANQRIRFCKKPVIAAPFGMTLGGGCEICLATAKRAAAVESYIGLVEAGAGVIPAGGGCKNLLLAFEKNFTGGPQPKVNPAFELIATARVGISAIEAKELGLLSAEDIIVMDREVLLYEAVEELKKMAANYAPPENRTDILLPGRGGEMALVNALKGFVAMGKASAYDVFVAEKLARVLTGGDEAVVHKTDEQHILDLEREAFLSLAGEEKTQARMEHLLTTGKPLRN